MSESKYRLGREQRHRQRLLDVALGRAHADIVLRGGTLLNVYTGELIPDTDIAILGDRIAAVGDATRTIGPETAVVDARGYYLVPGLVDSHYHIESSRLSPVRHAEATLPHGVTTLVEDSHEICNVIGADGVRYFLEEAELIPQHIYVTVSSATPPSPFETTAADLGPEKVAELMGQEGVVGLAEVMDFARLFGNDDRLHGMVEATRRARGSVEGHGDVPMPDLEGWVAAGLESTHGSNSGQATLDKIRRGVFVQLRASALEKSVPMLKETGVDQRLVGMAVDDRHAADLERLGHLDYDLRKGIEYGLDPVQAIRMATLNNAAHFGLDQEVGGIAPGRYADVLLVRNLAAFDIARVYASGRLVAEDGQMVAELAGRPIPEYVRGSVRLQRPLAASDFQLRAPEGRDRVKATVLTPRYHGADLESLIEDLPARGGLVQVDPERGICKFAIVERHKATGRVGVSFWRLGFQRGAVAGSIAHDHHNIWVAGADDGDMAAAVNRVAEMEGGFAVVEKGRVLAEMALPIAGLMTDRPLETVVREIQGVERATRSLGPAEALGPDASMYLTYVTLTCYPWVFNLTDQGLLDLRSGEKLPVVW